MSAPLASDIASRTGVIQQNVSPKNIKVNKESEQGRHTVHGPDDEEERQEKAGFAKGAGGPKGAGQAQFGQDDKTKVKRKRVKLKDIASGKTSKSGGTAETERNREAQAGEKAKAKEAPSNAREMGIKRATNFLNQQSRLTEASVRYEQRAQQDSTGSNPLTPKGQQRWMLNNLIKMSEMNYNQHTGGQAGELLNRRSSREVYMALRGLRDGTSAPKENTSTSSNRRMSPGEFKSSQAKAMSIINHVLEPPVRPENHEPLELVG